MRRRLATGCLAVLSAIAACGSSSTSGSPGGTEAAKDPTSILGDAVTALEALKSYRVVFSGKDTAGTLMFDITIDGVNHSAVGTMTQSGVPSPITIVGSTLYVQQQPLAEALLQRVFGTTSSGWVRLPLSTIPNLATIVNPSQLAQCATDQSANPTSGSQSKVNGVSTIALQLDSDNNNVDALNVSLDGQNNVVQWTIEEADIAPSSCTGGAQVAAGVDSAHPSSLIGIFIFSAFGKNVTVSPPASVTDPPPIESGY
jgi:hypothetical protein